MEHSPQPTAELDINGEVEAKLLPQLGQIDIRGVGAQDHRRRIARRQMDDHEVNDRDHGKYRQQIENPLDDVFDHRAVTSPHLEHFALIQR